MNEPRKVAAYLGYPIFAQGISYNCPELKLYGYRDELALARAIYRTLGKWNIRSKDAEKPNRWFDGMVKAEKANVVVAR